ncbi:gamma-glutamylcyclotransferase [Thioclava sp. SK-1]|uniref:gamma-glutamylcyclotransferase n=1 Tax=Thioclava sp. SK-1 TaxID=1889770 RepID=UPI00082444E8|nr:gamma-glutamylcyclotransferase [Thioclava sp. SK-1]OCX66119.1 gamma-glutamylcyclotransferase [Thioclava sp. SK-1]
MTETLWIFGYGSLIWRPGFTPAERILARAEGWTRSFCMTSIHYRGTTAQPGLVLALDHAPGSVCSGLALSVPAGEEEEVLAYLRARELVSDAYEERRIPLLLADGRKVEAVTYVIRHDCGQFVQYDLETQAKIIAQACGEVGPNCDYLWNTAQHLSDLGVADPDLDWLAVRVRVLRQDIDV